ncbi:SUMF1/EgtB/PvdO family nonheme iron enzyme [Ensifer sp. ZNC0028]|uniref:SUMF1/EgtB/PvdO family nonheme iron enzyme n=1 Tax=Ensifer sp. ZNC0028 TaxID=1339236 RepID=UPI0006892739|nr:SUMF1/EgtB/PvdO family nonheme iron enzyme [Ensifer sp. ZNC0028]
MPSTKKTAVSLLSLAAPAVLLAAIGGVLSAKVGLFDDLKDGIDLSIRPPVTVTIAPRQMSYRAEGHFLKNGFAVDAPIVVAALKQPLEIMKYQVTRDDYERCVADGGCQQPEGGHGAGLSGVPMTGVNYTDATDYAAWLTKKTGAVWRLPTDQQWAFAAGSKFPDDALGIDGTKDNPALRWLADYERESSRQRAKNPMPQPSGAFGENEYGVADLDGNVWEWTETCHRRVTIGDDGEVLKEAPACGIFVVNGKHRASMSFFIRDPKSGGCAVGVPPDNLGFRLVRDGRWYSGYLYAFERRFQGAG